jgi:hypothetical protein
MFERIRCTMVSRRPWAIAAGAVLLALTLFALTAGVAHARSPRVAPRAGTNPPAITGLNCLTPHFVEATWYSDNTPNLIWDTATATDAAVAGYSYLLDQDALAVPDTVVDVPSLTFGANVNYVMGDGCQALAVADFSGDGKKDIASANSLANTISVRLAGNGGLFNASSTLPTGTGPLGIAAADFNGDLKQDLVTANNGASSVSVFIGTGTGTFGVKTDYTVGSGPYSVAVGDVNGDANIDLVTANYTAATVSVLLGNGNGTFQAKTDFTVGTGPYGVAVCQLNADTNLDLAVADFDAGTISVLLGTGTGSFGAKTDYTTGNGTAAVAAADFNGDGKTDVMATNNGPSTVSVLLGNGDGTLQAKVDYATGLNPYGLAVADLNADGRLDLATADYGLDKISTLLGNGDGTFGVRTDFGSFASGVGVRAVALADTNADGKLDLVTGNYLTDNVSVLNNTRTASVNFSAKADAIWYFHVRVIDSQGAGGATSMRTIRIDVTAPTAISGLGSSTHPIATDWYANPAPAFFWSASTDATSGLAGYSYAIDLVPAQVTDVLVETTELTTSFLGKTDGTWYFHIRAVDLAGNMTTTVHRMARIDTTAPVTAQSGSDGAWHDQDVTVTFTPTDVASGMVGGLAKTEWSTDAGATWTQGTSVVVPAPLGGGNDGSHDILYHSYDKLGNTESIKTCAVKIDTLAPVSTLGATPLWTNTELTVALTAIDAGCGVASKQYRFDEGLWTKGSSVTIRAPVDHSFDGTHTIEYRSIDALFNTETPQTRTVGVDTLAPVTTDNSDALTHRVFVLVFAPGDATSGVALTEYRIDGGAWQSGTSVTLRLPIRHRLGGLSPGDHLIEYLSTDNAGNVETIKSCTVTIG